MEVFLSLLNQIMVDELNFYDLLLGKVYTKILLAFFVRFLFTKNKYIEHN